MRPSLSSATLNALFKLYVGFAFVILLYSIKSGLHRKISFHINPVAFRQLYFTIKTDWLIQLYLLTINIWIWVSYSKGPLIRRSAIPNLAAVCASIYHTIHTLTLTLSLKLNLILGRIADLWNSRPVPISEVNGSGRGSFTVGTCACVWER